MIKKSIIVFALLATNPAFSQDLAEPPTSPVIVSNPPAEVQEARRGGGSGGSVGSAGLLAISTVLTIGIIYGIVQAVSD